MNEHHRVSVRRTVWCLAFLFWSAVAPVSAETAQSSQAKIRDQVDVYGVIEDFTWKEFDLAGSRLVTESGRRGGVGFAYAVDFSSGLTLRPRLEVIGGQVDHDGQTQTGTPVFSDTNYVGARFEIDLGGKLGDRFTVEPFGGLGIRTWWREINDSLDINGAYAAGSTEEWSMMYGRLGLRVSLRVSDNLNLFFEGAGVLPWYSENKPYLTDVGYLKDPVLEPKARTTYVAEAGVRYRVFRISAFYETLRFDASDPEVVYTIITSLPETVDQPRSEANLFGVRAGASF